MIIKTIDVLFDITHNHVTIGATLYCYVLIVQSIQKLINITKAW